MPKPAKHSKQQVYDFIAGFIEQHEVPPTRQQIVQALGMASKSVADYYIVRLVKDGRLERVGYGKQRSIFLTNDPNRPRLERSDGDE